MADVTAPARSGAIPRRAAGAPAPLSFAQTRLWFFDRLMPGSPLYNISFAAPIRFALDVRVLHQAMQEIVRRHEVLRTVFALDGEEPVQIVLPSVAVPIKAMDLRRLPAARRQAEAVRLAASFQDQPFDLGRGPLLRVMVAWLAPRDYLLVFAVHHVAADGWSLGILARELETTYQALARGRRPELPPLPIQYADFAVWQRERLSGAALAAEVDHWRERLADLPVQDLPTDRPRPPVQLHRGADLAFTIPTPLADRLARLGRERRATQFMVLLAAFDVVLGRWSAQEDVVVGAPIANRNRVETEPLIGFFVNTLVLRVDLSGAPTFAELLDRVRTVALDAYAHQDLPFEKLVEELAPERDLSRNPLVQVIFQLFESAEGRQAGLSLPSRTSLFDLRVDLAPGPGGLAGRVEYDADLFDAATIERLTGCFLRLLEQVAADPGRPIGDYALLGAEEREAVLALGRGERVTLPEGWVHDWIAAQDPAAVALIDPASGARVCFGELNARAERLARRLAGRGIGRGDVVGVSLPRSPDLVVALLGVLRAGAAYLPLELDLPEARRAFMAADAGVSLVLTNTELDGEEADLPDLVGEDPAWVLYTSGSSGRPKGVPGTHLGLANRVNWGRHHQPWQRDDIAIAKSRLGFVDSVCELFAPLAAGIPVVLCDDTTAGDPLALAQLIARERVTALVTVPSLLALICDLAPETLVRLRRINISGEPLPPALASTLTERLPDAQLWNVYGTTEVAADATAHLITSTSGPRIPIGRPLDNTTIELHDSDGELVPLGATGEIVIGGHCTSPGYLGHAVTDNHRFHNHTYRTGDLGRWRPDGTLEHHGRADRQLKIRGARVEPDELEHALTNHPHIKEAAVVTRPTPDGPALAAYYATTAPLDAHNLRQHLTTELPAQLVPTHLVELPQLPHLPNGKLDRRSLTDQPSPTTQHPTQPPQTPTEHAVAEIYAQLTTTQPINRHDDFFALGGHSLLATRAVARLSERLEKAIDLRLIFEHRTVAALAAAVDALDASPGTRIEPLDRERFRIT